jgi:tetratricopeptide (TPR) repeat protein
VYESRLRGALADARRAGERADANYRGARGALRQMLSHTSNPRWNDVPRMQQLRRDQAEEALRFFESIAAQPERDPVVRQDVAWACVEGGKLLIVLGRKKDAEKLLERAVAVIDDLPDAFRSRPDARRVRADALVALGSYIDADPTRGRLPSGVAELEKLVKRDPTSNDARDALASALINLSGAQINGGNPAAAAPALRRAIAIFDDRLSEHPDEFGTLLARARARINLAAAYRQLGDFSKSRQAHALAETELEAAVARDKNNRDAIEGLAALRINGAEDLEAQGKLDGAAAYVLQNIPMLEAALDREPGDALIRDRLYRTFGVAALMHDKAGRPLEAAAAWERMLEFNPPETRLEHLLQFVEILASTSQAERALAAAAEVRPLLVEQPSSGAWKRIAAALDRCAEAAEGDLAQRCRAAAEDARREDAAAP